MVKLDDARMFMILDWWLRHCSAVALFHGSRVVV